MPLTRDEILALDGPALDAAVATEVMGWKRGTPPHDGMWFDDANCGRWNSHWQPHKRWNHAGEVVEAMREKGWLVVVKFAPEHTPFLIGGSDSEYAPSDPTPFATGKAVCELLWMGEPWRHDEFAVADACPLAICRAALLAMMAEREETA